MLLALLAAFSVAPLVGLAIDAHLHGLVWSGADSPYPADEYQYLSWVRQYAHHLLAANSLDVLPSAHVFLHPMFLVSGIAVLAGLSTEAAYLLWMPVAVVVAFLGVRAYAARFLPAVSARALAIVIGLFFVGPAAAVADWASLGSAGRRAELGGATVPPPGVLLWGYLPTVIAIGLMPVFLLGAERLIRSENPALRTQLVLAACGAAIAWLHPWQAEVVLVTTAAGVALGAESRRRAARLGLPFAGLLAPIAYYYVLSRADADWSFAQHANTAGGHVAAWALAIALLPVVVPAIAGLKLREADLGQRMLQLWPAAALVVYLALSPSFAQHSLEGVGIPLGILAVRGVWRARNGIRWAAALTGLVVVPGCVHDVQLLSDAANADVQPFYLQRDDQRALDYLAHVRGPGAVLPSPFLSSLVPARTDRQTWIGHPSWTRDYSTRVAEANALFDGRLAGPDAVALVRRSGARFLLADCHQHGPALSSLDLIIDTRRFGCASVYRVSGGSARARR
jgi:hypothetical protein